MRLLENVHDIVIILIDLCDKYIKYLIYAKMNNFDTTIPKTPVINIQYITGLDWMNVNRYWELLRNRNVIKNIYFK